MIVLKFETWRFVGHFVGYSSAQAAVVLAACVRGLCSHLNMAVLAV